MERHDISSDDSEALSSEAERTSTTTSDRRAIPTTSATTVGTSLTSDGTDLRPSDVLLGRGTGPANHPGNIYFRDVVERIKPSYVDTPSRKVKNKLVLQVVNDIKSRGGRFLRKQAEGGGSGGKGTDDPDADSTSGAGEGDVFQVVNDVVAFEKTKQAIRYVHYKKEPNQIEKKQTQQSWAGDASPKVHSTTSLIPKPHPKRRPDSLLESSVSNPKRTRSGSTTDQDDTNNNDTSNMHRRNLSTGLAGSGGTADNLSRGPGLIGHHQPSGGFLDSLPAGFSITSQGSAGSTSSIPPHFFQSSLSALLQQQQLASLGIGPVGPINDPRLLLLLAQHHQQQQQSQNQLLSQLSSFQGPFGSHLLDALLIRGSSGNGLAGAMTSLGQNSNTASTNTNARLHSFFPSLLSSSVTNDAPMPLSASEPSNVSDSLARRSSQFLPSSFPRGEPEEEKSTSRGRTGVAPEEKSPSSTSYRSPRKSRTSKTNK